MSNRTKSRLAVTLAALGVAIPSLIWACDAGAQESRCVPVASQGWQEQVCEVPAEQLVMMGTIPLTCKLVSATALRCFTGEYIEPRWIKGAKPRCEWLCAKKVDKRKRRL